MSYMKNREILRVEHETQMREREYARQQIPLSEIIAALPPLTDAQRKAQTRARLLYGGPGTAIDDER